MLVHMSSPSWVKQGQYVDQQMIQDPLMAWYWCRISSATATANPCQIFFMPCHHTFTHVARQACYFPIVYDSHRSQSVCRVLLHRGDFTHLEGEQPLHMAPLAAVVAPEPGRVPRQPHVVAVRVCVQRQVRVADAQLDAAVTPITICQAGCRGSRSHDR